MGLATTHGSAVSRGLWRAIRDVALTDVSVLVKGLSHEQIEQLEQVLIEADFGPAAFDLIEELETAVRRGKLKSEAAMREWIVGKIVDALDGAESIEKNLNTNPDGPTVFVMLGVNGVGKTTQAAKLASKLKSEGASVLLAAADTFRAGANEQLQIWADRLNVPCVTGTPGADPAAVAFDAVEAARARNIDVAIVDTAGRLHTHSDLMTELTKIIRVVGRRCDGAPHESFLVLDGTIGQNIIQQGRTFSDAVPVTGLILTKMDGTAKGGAVVQLHRELRIPIRFIGVGEGLDDLEMFDARHFAERLVGT